LRVSGKKRGFWAEMRWIWRRDGEILRVAIRLEEGGPPGCSVFPSRQPKEINPMRSPVFFRSVLAALFVLFAGLTQARADSGTIVLTVYKGGWIIGGSAGGGTLYFHGRSYPLSVGGIDYGLVFGGSKTTFRGRVSNIFRPSDVAGVYGAAGAGLAVGAGVRGIVLTNPKGAVLELSGQQIGLMANADLSGLAISMR
jgi:hypothetical protein